MSLATRVSSYNYDSSEATSSAPSTGFSYVGFTEELSFKTFYRRWQQATLIESSPRVMMESPHFKSILQLGREITPLVIAELKSEPSFLVLVLERLYGSDQIDLDLQGDLVAMTKAWIEWYQNSNEG